MALLDPLHFGDLASICNGGSGKESINWKDSELCMFSLLWLLPLDSEQLHHPGVQLLANTS